MALSPEPPSSPDSGPARATLSRLHKAIFDIALPKTASARTCTVPLSSIQHIRKLVDDLASNTETQPLDPRVTELSSKLDIIADKIDAITATRHVTSAPASGSYAEAVKASPPSPSMEPSSPTVPIDPSISSKLPLSHVAILKHVEDQDRQLLIDTIREHAPADFDLAKLGEEVLVQKGNSALEMIPEYSEEIGHFIGARLLSNGGVILEADDGHLIRWILDNLELSLVFKKNFAGTADKCVELRDRTWPVVLDFVPVTHNVGDEDEMYEMGVAAKLDDPWLIGESKWLKPPENRRPEQTTASLLVRTWTRENANALILSGTIVKGKRVFGRRLEKRKGFANIREQSYRFFPDPFISWTWEQTTGTNRQQKLPQRQSRQSTPHPPQPSSPNQDGDSTS